MNLTYTKIALTASLVGGALFLFSMFSLTALAAPPASFGGATQTGGQATLVSDLSDGSAANDFSGLSLDDANGTTFSSLTALGTDYNITNDDCMAGSPRFQIAIDTDADTVSNGNVFVYIGPSPSFSGCTAGAQSTGNLIGNNDPARYDYSQLGGPLGGTYATAPANVQNGTIVGMSLVVDSGWAFGDSEQTIEIDNVVLNATTYDFSPPPVTVTITKYIDGAPATAESADNADFPMTAVYSASNIGSGSDPYPLSETNTTPYVAQTIPLASGADYSTFENTDTAVVGADCTEGKPYALVGYTTGDTAEDAASGTPSATVPAFTGLTSDRFVVVWNEECTEAPAELAAPTNISPANNATLTTAEFDKADWTDVAGSSTPITYRYESSLSSTTDGDGSFSSPIFESGVLTDSEIPTAGTGEGTYYWHARAVDDMGSMSPWSSVFVVTVDNDTAPPPPTDLEQLISHLEDLQDMFPAFADDIQTLIDMLNGGSPPPPPPPPPPPSPPPSNPSSIDNNGRSVGPSGHLDFVGRNFGNDETVLMTLSGSLLRTLHADGGGNFSTGSMTAPSSAGTYHYVFSGQTSGRTATSTITVTP